MKGIRFSLIYFVSVFLLIGASLQADVIDGADFRADFQDGWLTSWTNKESGETFSFGLRDDLNTDPDSGDRFYVPGTWSIKKGQTQGDKVTYKVAADGADALRIVMSGQGPKDLQALQWGLRLPFDQFDAVHWPRGLAPARITGKGAVQSMWIRPFYPLDGREGVLSTHDWRMRYYIIQGKKGGLLIYVEDPKNVQANILEYKTDRKGEVTISNRAMAFAPFSDSFTTAPWVIRQYEGDLAAGAKLYQDYLEKAYEPTPLDKRPTAWVQDLAWTFVGAPWTRPLPFPGKPRPYYNYTSGWEESMEADMQWLENLSKVLEPEKTMFYLTDWRVSGHDTYFPDQTVDPYFAMMVGKVRAKGFHVMLHIHNHLIQEPTTYYQRLVAKQSEWLGHDPEKEVPWGVGYDILRDHDMIQRDKDFGGGWTKIGGQKTVMTGYHMTPAYEAQRNFKAAEILSIVRATGADAVHLDVPSYWMEGHNDRYGMNIAQGMGEMYKLIRKALDENGLQHVAIATELSPGESYFKYVDLAQNVRTNSINQLLTGEFATEDLLELQVGDNLDKAQAARDLIEKQKAEKRFDVDFYKQVLSKMREIHEPALDAMVLSPWVRGYPHLGASWPNTGGYPGDPARPTQNQVIQSLDLWYTLLKDTTLHMGGGAYNMFMDTAPWDSLDVIQVYRKRFLKDGINPNGKIFNHFDYGKFALARFFEKYQPVFADLSTWQPEDLARYRLNDGRDLMVRASEPLILSLTLSGGSKVADLNIFEGWQNADYLFGNFAPTFLENQID